MVLAGLAVLLGEVVPERRRDPTGRAAFTAYLVGAIVGGGVGRTVS